MHHMEHIWTMVMLKICKHTFYAYLSRIWKLMQFTYFIRRVLATKNLAIRKVFVFSDSGVDPTPVDIFYWDECICSWRVVYISFSVYHSAKVPSRFWLSLSAFLSAQKSAQKSKTTQKRALESKFTLLGAQKSAQTSGFAQNSAQLRSFAQKRAQLSGLLKKGLKRGEE